MTTRLYRVEVLLTCYVAADSEEEAKNGAKNNVGDVMEESDITEYRINVKTGRVKELSDVPESMHDSVPYGITSWDCECCEIDQLDADGNDRLIDYPGRGFHLPTCGYGLTCRELIAAQDRDRGMDGVTLPLIDDRGIDGIRNDDGTLKFTQPDESGGEDD
jgi:hypothetical protein